MEPDSVVATAASGYLTFGLDGQRFALDVAAVLRVLRAVEVTPLPEGPAVVLGVVNVRGRVLPVIDMRRRLGLPSREVRGSDRFIVVRLAGREALLAADGVGGVIDLPAGRVVGAEHIVPGLGLVSGAIRCEDGVILIWDLDRFLPLEDLARLDEAVRRASPENEA